MLDDTGTPVVDTGAAVADTGADTGLDFDISEPTTTTDTGTTPVTETEQPTTEVPEAPVQREEPEVTDFRGMVSGRIRSLVKQAPELGQVLTKYPKVRDAIEAPLRREAAYRDVFPTVAEAKAMRETFPNGLQDVQALQSDIKEIEETDALTYTRDRDGNYNGHPKLIQNVFDANRDAAISLFKTLPREWYRLDPTSYSEVMGKVVGATLTGSGAWEQLIDARGAAEALGEPGKGTVALLDKVLQRLSSFVEEKRPDPASEALNRERAQFDRQRQDNDKQENQKFHNSFVQDSAKLQREVISQHKVMQKLAAIKSVTPQQRTAIVEKVRVKMEQFLRNSPSFMRPLTKAYEARNMEETQKVQRAYWSQDWLLNRMVRDVLKVETPQLIAGNRATVERRAGAPATKQPDKSSDGKTAAPTKVAGQWYNADGRRMTVAEAIKQEMAQG